MVSPALNDQSCWHAKKDGEGVHFYVGPCTATNGLWVIRATSGLVSAETKEEPLRSAFTIVTSNWFQNGTKRVGDGQYSILLVECMDVTTYVSSQECV